MNLSAQPNNWRTIQLVNGGFTIVDEKLFESLNKFHWYKRKFYNCYYAARKVPSGKSFRWIFLHRLLIRAPQGFVVHHINHNPLDNRLENLMPLTIKEHRFHHFTTLESSKILKKTTEKPKV